MKKLRQIPWLMVFITAVFFMFRLPLLHNLYHQDEYKWAQIVDPYFGKMGEIPHPPLAEVTYHFFGQLFGFLNLRVVPLLFSIGIIWLLYRIVADEYGKKTGVMAAFLYAIVPYAVMASIQIDIDGAILPFWVLLTVWCWRKYVVNPSVKTGVGVVGALAGGFLSKISFILIGPSLLYEAFNRGIFHLKFSYLKKASLILGAFISGSLLLFGILAWLYPGLQLGRIVTYAESFSFLNFGSRNYAQVIFLSAKAAMLVSPVLLVALYGMIKDWKKYAFWVWYILSGLLFYLVVFDFSNRTLDRYLMILTLPVVIIAADVLVGWLKNISYSPKIAAVFMLVGAIGVFIVTLPVRVLPLVPKEAYVEAIRAWRLDFLIPFSSGSGPIGFYQSVLFIGVAWFLALILVVGLVRRPNTTWAAATIFLVISGYSVLFNVEAGFGTLYGSPNQVAHRLVTTVLDKQKISQVITYNDIAGYELSRSGKYYKRFYTHPIFAASTVNKMKEYSGFYLVVDFPEIDKTSVYWDYLQSCRTQETVQSGLITGYIFDCSYGKKELLQ